MCIAQDKVIPRKMILIRTERFKTVILHALFISWKRSFLSMSNRPRVLVSLFFSAFLLVFASSAVAADNNSEPDRFGARAGVSGDPGQFYIGAHMDLKEIRKNIWFRPNLEVGVGDGLALISLNGEFVYFWKGQQNRHWMPYAGLGPAFVIQAFSSGNGDSSVGPGLN